MSQFTPIAPESLGVQHLGRTVYIKFPPAYQRDFTIGAVEAILADRMSISVRLRGGIEGASILRESAGTPQEEIWLVEEQQ